jgi:hypothetical protein
MPTKSAALQLAIEKPLKDLVVAQQIFPNGFDVHCAHDLKKVTSKNYLEIIADLPAWQGDRGTFADVKLTFQVVTDVTDPDKRSDQTANQQEYLGDLMELFLKQNFFTVRAALNATADGIGFIGWSELAHEDGQDAEEKTVAPKLNYNFRIYRS